MYFCWYSVDLYGPNVYLSKKLYLACIKQYYNITQQITLHILQVDAYLMELSGMTKEDDQMRVLKKLAKRSEQNLHYTIYILCLSTDGM